MKRINLIDTPVLKDGRYLAPISDGSRWGLYEPDGRLRQPLSLYEARMVDSTLFACEGFLQYARMTERHQAERIETLLREGAELEERLAAQRRLFWPTLATGAAIGVVAAVLVGAML